MLFENIAPPSPVLSIFLWWKLKQANKEFYFSPTVTEDVEHEMTPSGNYVDLQIKMHSAYTLLKAFNSGAINEEEYERLKKDLLVKCFKL